MRRFSLAVSDSIGATVDQLAARSERSTTDVFIWAIEHLATTAGIVRNPKDIYIATSEDNKPRKGDIMKPDSQVSSQNDIPPRAESNAPHTDVLGSVYPTGWVYSHSETLAQHRCDWENHLKREGRLIFMFSLFDMPPSHVVRGMAAFAEQHPTEVEFYATPNDIEASPAEHTTTASMATIHHVYALADLLEAEDVAVMIRDRGPIGGSHLYCLMSGATDACTCSSQSNGSIRLCFSSEDLEMRCVGERPYQVECCGYECRVDKCARCGLLSLCIPSELLATPTGKALVHFLKTEMKGVMKVGTEAGNNALRFMYPKTEADTVIAGLLPLATTFEGCPVSMDQDEASGSLRLTLEVPHDVTD